jgi:hypothetical protein
MALLNSVPTYPSFIESIDVALASFTWALVVISAGTVSLYASYYLAKSKSSGQIWPVIGDRDFLFPNAVTLWLLSFALHAARLEGIVSRGNALLYHFSLWHLFLIVLFLVSFFSRRGKIQSSRFLGVLLVAELFLVTVIAFRLEVLLMLITILSLSYNYRGPGITFKRLAGLGGVIAVLFPISEVGESLQAGESLSQALFIGATSGPIGYVDAFVGRMIGMDAMTMVISRTPEPVPYQGGETLLLAIYGLIPRALWAGKPGIIMCRLNNLHFSGRGVPGNACSAMTVPVEFYWNFGIAGVVIGLFGVGITLGGVYRWFSGQLGREESGYVAILVYAIVLITVMKFEIGFAQLISNLVKQLVLAVALIGLVTELHDTKTIELSGESAWEQSTVYKALKSVNGTATVRSSLSLLWLTQLISALIRLRAEYASVTRTSEIAQLLKRFDKKIAELCIHSNLRHLVLRRGVAKGLQLIRQSQIYQLLTVDS